MIFTAKALTPFTRAGIFTASARLPDASKQCAAHGPVKKHPQPNPYNPATQHNTAYTLPQRDSPTSPASIPTSQIGTSRAPLKPGRQHSRAAAQIGIKGSIKPEQNFHYLLRPAPRVCK